MDQYIVRSGGRVVGTVLATSREDAVATVTPKAPDDVDVVAYRHTALARAKGRK